MATHACRRPWRCVAVSVTTALLAAGALPVLVAAPAGAAGTTWSTSGPSEPGPVGAARAVASVPGSTIAYVGTAAGVYRSPDAGQSWYPVGLAADDVRALAVVPGSAGTLLAGTATRGVWRSTDGGSTWQDAQVGFPSGMPVVGFATTPTHVYAAFASGVGVTDDGGASWASQAVPASLTGVAAQADDVWLSTMGAGVMHATRTTMGAFTAVAGSPGSSYAVGSRPGTSHLVVGLQVAVGYFDGLAWQQLGTVNGTARGITFTSAGDMLVAAQGVYRVAAGGNGTLAAVGALSADATAVTESDGALLAATAAGLQRYALGAWTTVGSSTSPLLPSVLAAGTTGFGSSYVLIGMQSGGVFGSLDGGTTWHRRDSGLPAGAPVTALLPVSASLTYAAAGTRVYRSLDQGGSWAEVTDAQQAITGMAVDPATPERVHLASASSGVLTVEGTAGWIGYLEPAGQTSVEVTALVAGPTAGTLYAGTNSFGVYVSTDSGHSWLPTAGAGSGTSPAVTSLTVDQSRSPATLWVGTEDGRAFRSTDPGSSYTEVSTGLPSGASVHLTTTGGRVLAGAASSTAGGVFELANGAWTSLTTQGLTERAVIDVRVEPAGVLHAATAAGVFDLQMPAAPHAAPVITDVAPQSAAACVTVTCADLVIEVTGSGYDSDMFATTAVYRLDGQLLGTGGSDIYRRQSVLIPGDLLRTPRTAELTVSTTDGLTSAPVPFFVTEMAVPVTDVATGTASDGTVAVSTGNGAYAASGEGSGSVTLATYDGNPVGVAAPGGAESFFDVYLSAGSAFATLTVVDCALSSTNTSHLVSWFDGTTWSPVSGQSYDPLTGCVTMTFDDVTSSPTTAQLVGTVFAYGPDPAVVTLASTVEGAFAVSTGQWVSAGLRLKLATKSRSDVQVDVSDMTFTLPVTCLNGDHGEVTFALPDLVVQIPKGSTSWLPTSDKDSRLGFQGASRANVCPGARTTLAGPATIRARVTSSLAAPVALSFHYRDPAAKRKADLDCSSSANTVAGLDDCSAGWSEAVVR